jgi:hypothetical protein
MLYKWKLLKNIIGLLLFLFLSCYSRPVNVSNLIDYSDTIDSNMIFDIGISIFNKNLALLKQNIQNEIIQSNGEITQEEIANINSYRIVVNIPRNNTVIFMNNIKRFGIITDESKRNIDFGMRNIHNKNRLVEIRFMLEKYTELLRSANTIADKIMLEKEIINAKMEIESMESYIKDMESKIKYNIISIMIYNK